MKINQLVLVTLFSIVVLLFCQPVNAQVILKGTVTIPPNFSVGCDSFRVAIVDYEKLTQEGKQNSLFSYAKATAEVTQIAGQTGCKYALYLKKQQRPGSNKPGGVVLNPPIVELDKPKYGVFLHYSGSNIIIQYTSNPIGNVSYTKNPIGTGVSMFSACTSDNNCNAWNKISFSAQKPWIIDFTISKSSAVNPK